MRGALLRALAVFRLVAAANAVATVGDDLGRAEHPARSLSWFVVVALWSAVMSLFAPAAGSRRPRVRDALVVADVGVCVR